MFPCPPREEIVDANGYFLVLGTVTWVVTKKLFSIRTLQAKRYLT